LRIHNYYGSHVGIVIGERVLQKKSDYHTRRTLTLLYLDMGECGIFWNQYLVHIGDEKRVD
jgi:hypothetical protein